MADSPRVRLHSNFRATRLRSHSGGGTGAAADSRFATQTYGDSEPLRKNGRSSTILLS
jgi:hypothetical protein